MVFARFKSGATIHAATRILIFLLQQKRDNIDYFRHWIKTLNNFMKTNEHNVRFTAFQFQCCFCFCSCLLSFRMMDYFGTSPRHSNLLNYHAVLADLEDKLSLDFWRNISLAYGLRWMLSTVTWLCCLSFESFTAKLICSCESFHFDPILAFHSYFVRRFWGETLSHASVGESLGDTLPYIMNLVYIKINP